MVDATPSAPLCATPPRAARFSRARAALRSVRGLVPMLILGLISACSLLISTPELTAHCTFQGSTTVCGKCLVARCQDAIDNACSDGTELAQVLPVIEACASKSDAACTNVPASAATSCMNTLCAAVCYKKDGVSATHCAESFLSPGQTCTCETATAGVNEARCDTVAYPGTKCCAPSAWPGPALSCTCNAVLCVPTSVGCNCILSDNVAPDTATTCRGDHCCANADHCECHPRACQGAEREVAECNVRELACPALAVEQTSCSIRR